MRSQSQSIPGLLNRPSASFFGHPEDIQSNSNMSDLHEVAAVAAAIAVQAAIQAIQDQLQSNMEAMTQSMGTLSMSRKKLDIPSFDKSTLKFGSAAWSPLFLMIEIFGLFC